MVRSALWAIALTTARSMTRSRMEGMCRVRTSPEAPLGMPKLRSGSGS